MRERTEAICRLSDFDSHGTTRARSGGQSVEVEQGVPGELVRLEILGGRRPRGRLLEVLEPAADRVSPPCLYFRDWKCGGCQWQHMSYEGQVRRKLQRVEHVLRKHGLKSGVRQVHTLPDPWRYRSTASISLGKRAGFRRHGSLAIVPIRDCLISDSLIGTLMARLNDLLEKGYLPDFRGRVRLEVRLSETVETSRLEVLVRQGDHRGPKTDSQNMEEDDCKTDLFEPLISALLKMPEVNGISVLNPGEVVRTVKGELFAPTSIAGKRVFLAASSFFQTNIGLLEKLIERLREECDRVHAKRLADVYGGIGVFGLFLADKAAKVVVIESDELATRAGSLTCAQWGVENVGFVNKKAEEGLEEIGPIDIVIVDPPRSGLTVPVINALVKQRPQLILYVSCLVESLSRDLKQLTERGFGLETVELFDFYPQTYHVELLSVLTRVGSEG